MLIQNFRYRPEIDGLRAVAVMAVVLYHAGMGFPGGFVGVDVFFVISGFLITSLILKDLEAGKFTLANFWERRARRIIPACAVMVFTVLAAGWFLLLPSDYANLGKSAVSQSIFGANIYFWRNTSYFGGTAEEKPLLHTWSLAVEEQFYLIVPLLLLLLFRFHPLRRRGVLVGLFSTALLGSLLVSILSLPHAPAATFYLLPTRAWELLCGSIVAILPAAQIRPWLRECLSWLGLFLVLGSCLLYTKQTPFPGLAALPPCIGTALFISATHSPSPSTPARLLSTRPVVFVGLVSYSFYLWHWPVFALTNYWALLPLSLTHRITMVVGSFILAIISWRLVETPFRKRNRCPSRHSIFAFGALATAILAASGFAIKQATGFPNRFPAEVQQLALAKQDMGFVNDLTTQDILEGRLTSFGNPSSQSPVRWLVWGDSHAMAALPAFDALLKERHLAGLAATHSATAPVLDYYLDDPNGLGPEAPAFSQAVLDYVTTHKIPNVVLVANWEAHDGNQPPPQGAIPFRTAVLETVHAIRNAGAVPWLLLTVPRSQFDVPRGLAWSLHFGRDISRYCIKPGSKPRFLSQGTEFLASLRQAGARVLDPGPAFLSHDHSHYIISSAGIPLYRDEGHLTTYGAHSVLLPFLRKSIASAPTEPNLN